MYEIFQQGQKCGLSLCESSILRRGSRGCRQKIYHLNIGQPDIETPPSTLRQSGIAIQRYYDALNMHFEKDEILITTGGSEALQIVFNCILDDGDEILIPEPFYPNYNTMVPHVAQRSTPSPPPRRKGTTMRTGQD